MLLPDVRLGAQRPRVCSVPTFATSAGSEAVDLAASFGLNLDPWQAFVLEQSLGERPDGKWAAFEVGLLCPRQNGKGSVLEARELAGLFVFGEKKITHSAHELKTSKDHFNRMEALLRNAGYGDDLVHYRRSNEEVSITIRKTGHKLLFLTRTSGGGRGLGGDLVVMDEAYNLGNDTMAALMPTMAARSLNANPQLWFTSSAGFSYSEVLAKVRHDGESGAGRLAYFDWSAAPDADADSLDSWMQANPGLGMRISEEFVASERRRLGDEEFRRERLGIWADAGAGSVVSDEMWAQVCRPESRRAGEDVVFGVSVYEDTENNVKMGAISVACASSVTGKVHLELIEAQEGVSWLPARLRELQARRKPRAVVVDSSGPAGSLLPELQAARMKVVLAPAMTMRKACGALLDGITARRVTHTGLQPTLSQSMSAGQRKRSEDGWVWRRTPDSAPAIATTLAYYGWLLKAPTVDPSRPTERRAVVM
jgi:hypothetical protein